METLEVRYIFTAVIAALVVGGLLWRFRPRRAREAGFGFVYVNQDGTVREISPGERAYLSQEFSGGDGGRPCIKSRYESTDGWGSQSGFIDRRHVPSQIPILPVHPDYDAREKEMGFDFLAPHRAAGDHIEVNTDGSISCTPNPNISGAERFKLSQEHTLEEQRRREALARFEAD